MALKPARRSRRTRHSGIGRGLLLLLTALLLTACSETRPQFQTSPLLQMLQRKVGRIGFIGPDGNVYSIDQSGGGQTPLTGDAGTNPEARTAVAYMQPTWAPDGLRMAFARTAVTAQRRLLASIWVTGGPGSSPREVFNTNSLRPIYLYWSPDSERLTLLSQPLGSAELELGVIDLDQDVYRPLDQGQPYYWSWLPDNSALVTHVGGDVREPDGPRPAPVATGGPNLILVTFDTTRADAWGAYGQRLPTTPVVDRMAREGVLFEQVATSNPETLPSHATLFTGLLPFSHGVRANSGFVLSERHDTLAEHLRARGYRTGAEVAAMVLRRETQVTQGFDHYRDPDSPGVELKKIRYRTGEERDETRRIRLGGEVTDKGIEFVRRNRDRRFFLWLHYFDAHQPYSAPGAFNRRIPESPYHAEVAYADHHFGRLLDEIRRLGLRDRTLVVATSDHGEGLEDHGEPTHSYFVYETVMRVPLILWGLGLPEGLRIDTLVRTADVAPTVLELLSLPPLPASDGVSAAGLVRGRARDLDVVAYGEATRFNATLGLPSLRFVREGRWKYIHKVNPELYDVIADPGELRNRLDEHPEIAERLRGRLEAMVAAAPKAPEDAQRTLDSSTAAELMALGYVARAPTLDMGADGESLALSGEDPSTLTGDVLAASLAPHYVKRKDWQKALETIEPVAKRHPKSAYAQTTMASALVGLGRDAEAILALERAIALDPGDRASRRSLATLLHDAGRSEEAAALLDGLLAEQPCSEDLRNEQYRVLHDAGRYDALIAMLAAGAERCPDLVANLNNYAWALATLPRDDLRDGVQAVAVIERALAAGGAGDPSIRDTQAVALAEAGRFDEAERITEGVLADLRAANVDPSVVAQIQAHLDAFRARQPVRDPADPATEPAASPARGG